MYIFPLYFFFGKLTRYQLEGAFSAPVNVEQIDTHLMASQLVDLVSLVNKDTFIHFPSLANALKTFRYDLRPVF